MEPGGPATADARRHRERYGRAPLWLGALLAAAGELPNPFPPPIGELARRYFEAYPPEVKA